MTAAEEKILDKRIGRDGAIKYLVKWKNYPVRDSTWVPVDDVGTPELIKAYEIEKSGGDTSIDAHLSPSLQARKSARNAEMSNSETAVCEVALVKWVGE